MSRVPPETPKKKMFYAVRHNRHYLNLGVVPVSSADNFLASSRRAVRLSAARKHIEAKKGEKGLVRRASPLIFARNLLNVWKTLVIGQHELPIYIITFRVCSVLTMQLISFLS